MRKRGEELTSPYREYEANYRDAPKRAEYSGPTPVRQKKIQAAQEEMAALQAQLEKAQKLVEPSARGTPEYWTWRPEMLEAKRAERQETISRLQAQIDELARRVEKLHAPTDYQARKMRRAQREAEEWQRRMQEETETERHQAGLQLLKLAGDKD